MIWKELLYRNLLPNGGVFLKHEGIGWIRWIPTQGMDMTLKHKHHGRFVTTVRNRILSGIFLLLPLAVTVVVIRWLFNIVFKWINPVVVKLAEYIEHIPHIGALPGTAISGIVTALTIFLLLFLLYLVGSVARWVIVRRFVDAGETMLLKIPLVRTVYSATQQVVKAVSLPGKESFKSVVLVEFPRTGFRAIGFITGYITDTQGMEYAKVFIPTTPNFTSGFFEIIPFHEVIETNLSMESAFTMLLSGGLVSPEDFQMESASRNNIPVEVG
jgi:uncharacterized membrane protein